MSSVHANRCLRRSDYLNAVQAIQAMREQYKISFPFTSCSLFRSSSMGPNLAVLTQANSPLETAKINKRTPLNIWAWGVCLISDCITSCLIFIFKRCVLDKEHKLPTKSLDSEVKYLFSFPPACHGCIVSAQPSSQEPPGSIQGLMMMLAVHCACPWAWLETGTCRHISSRSHWPDWEGWWALAVVNTAWATPWNWEQTEVQIMFSQWTWSRICK